MPHQGQEVWRKRGKEGEEMTLFLYECLTEVGLQQHYARFTAMGVNHAVQLSALTMEDYPILGVCSMEDQTRLFHLIQVIKTLNLEGDGCGSEGDSDENQDGDGGDEENAAHEGDSSEDGSREIWWDLEDEDTEMKAYDTRLNTGALLQTFPVRRRLDFSVETVNCHLEHISSPKSATSVYASPTSSTNLGSNRGRGSAIHTDFDAIKDGCGYKENNHDHMPSVQYHTSVHHIGENTKPDAGRPSAICNPRARLSPGHVSALKPTPNPRQMPAALKRCSNKPVGHEDKMRVSRRAKPNMVLRNHGTCREVTKPTPVYELNRTAGYNYGLPLSSPQFPSKKRAGVQRISVCVRKRPLTRSEDKRGEADVVTAQDGECVIVHESKEAVDLTQYILQHRYYFDQVFGEMSSNEEVYQRTAYPLVQHMLHGGKATCFAYGQTGAGKTHTMFGSSSGRPGLYALAAQDIFTHLSTTYTSSPLLVYVSLFEIYCGQLYDLLDHRKRLFAREDGQRVVQIPGLREVGVDSVDSLLEVISWGAEVRTQGVSGVNPVSSRSHALLQIQLRGPQQQLTGRMWFVDLAGSERAADTKEPCRQSRMEGAEINQSLLALKECIRSLDQEQSHTPFRQSKLTQVLKDSFIGNSKTCMIANISPGHLATEHTLNTLRYADRVKELRGQKGVRGVGRSKGTPSLKCNQSGSSSSGGSTSTRGKSPPKRPKLVQQTMTLDPNTPTGRLASGSAIFCSNLKNSRGREARSGWRRTKEIGLEIISPVMGSMGISDLRQTTEATDKMAGGQKREQDNEKRGGQEGYSKVKTRNRNSGPGLVRQTVEEQSCSWDMTREEAASTICLSSAEQPTGFCHRERERNRNTYKWKREEEKRRVEERMQEEKNSENIRDLISDGQRDTGNLGRRCRELERRENDNQKGGEREKEREKHLRWYHQQLQQFLPPSLLLSVPHPSCSSSACPSLSSSNQPTVSSSLSSFVSSTVNDDLEEVLDMYRATVELTVDVSKGRLHCRSEEMNLDSDIDSSIETTQSHNRNNNGADHVDSCDFGLDLSVPRDDVRTRSGKGSAESEERRSLVAMGGGEAGAKNKECRPMEMDGGQRSWAWVSTKETEEVDRMAGITLSWGEVPASSIHDSKGKCQPTQQGDTSDILFEGEWSTGEEEEAIHSNDLGSTDGNSDNNSFFHHTLPHYHPIDHPHQRTPAELPFSPLAHSRTDSIPTLDKLNDLSLEKKDLNHHSNNMPTSLENVKPFDMPLGVPKSSVSEKASGSTNVTFAGQTSSSLLALPPLPHPPTQNRFKVPAKALDKYSEAPVIVPPVPITSLASTQVINDSEIIDKTSEMSVSSTDVSSGDFQSGIMDCLSLSMLQVDQGATTASFLFGKKSITNTCPLKNKRGDNRSLEGDEEKMSYTEMERKGIEDEDGEFGPSLLELLEVKIGYVSTTKAAMADDHTSQKEHVYSNIPKPTIPAVALVSFQNQRSSQKSHNLPRNEVPEIKNTSSLTSSPHTPIQAFHDKSITHSVRCSGYTVPLNNHTLNLSTQILPEHAQSIHNETASTNAIPQAGRELDQLNTVSRQYQSVGSNHPNKPHKLLRGKIVESLHPEGTTNQHTGPTVHLSTPEELDPEQWHVVQAQSEHLEEMEALCLEEGTLLCQQTDMTFAEYVHRLEEIMERKAWCVQSMRSQLQSYLRLNSFNRQHN